MEKISVKQTARLLIGFTCCMCAKGIYAHDTTHIHPLITQEISNLISDTDASIGAYSEIYLETPEEQKDPSVPSTVTQRLYWGTDFDPVDYPATGTQSQKEDHLLDLDGTRYARYTNVIDGVIQEDIPAEKVLKHFYQAENGEGLSLESGVLPFASSAKTAMQYFNQSIRWMSGYDTIEPVAAVGGHIDYSARQHAFFVFGQVLHHVEDMISPDHIHNDVENALFDPVLRYSPGKNTHVLIYTLRFLHGQSLALSPTGSFSGDMV